MDTTLRPGELINPLPRAGGSWTRRSLYLNILTEANIVQADRNTPGDRSRPGPLAAGTIINPLTAHGQSMGGMIWSIGSALHEETEIDPEAARYVDDNVAEYLIPVNADIRLIEVIMAPERDEEVNPLGIRGIGEIGIVGMNAAVSNAVFHATGRRVRNLPIRIKDLL